MNAKPKAKKRKPVAVQHAGVSVRLFKRSGMYWLDVWKGDVRSRVSAKTKERSAAEAAAKALAEEIAKQQLLGVTPDTLTLAELFTAYHDHKGRHLEGQYLRAIDTRRALFLAAWGGSTPVAAISQTSVDTYSATRRRQHLERQQRTYQTAEARRIARHVKRHGTRVPVPSVPPPTFQPLRDGALDPEFRWLSSVFNWAIKHKLVTGKRLLTLNPLHDCKWPREQNIRRPIASQDRYTRTLEHAEAVDPMGRFRLALVLARYTARRIDAILHLGARDVLLTSERIRAVLADLGEDEGLGEGMTHGAILWRAAHDKQGIDRVTPISPLVRAALDAYLKANPRLGDVPLIPSANVPLPGQPVTPLARSTATNWIAKAERLAELPKLRGGLWHAYRRLWATERKNQPDVDVAEAGGWTGTKAMKLSYQKHTPAGVLAAVMGG